MAGNTKLIGFALGNKVVLERWGGRTEVELPPQAIRALTEAVREDLPDIAPLAELEPEFEAFFSPQTGRVMISLNRDTAERLSEGWEADWIEKLETAIHTHKDFFDRDEPGL